jgi:hypothetical protein
VNRPDSLRGGELFVVGQFPEAVPELLLELAAWLALGVGLGCLADRVDGESRFGRHGAREDPPEHQQGVTFQRVFLLDEMILKLDDQRIDVDLLIGQRQVARDVDRPAASVVSIK